MAVVVDSAGNLYVADWGNECIWKINRWGKVERVAGNGHSGYSGDGGPAFKARLHCPHDIAFDAAGNLYITDAENQRIRKVDQSGIIQTVAGCGIGGYLGDGRKATETILADPRGIAFDAANNLYIAQSYGCCILRVDKAGNVKRVVGTWEEGCCGASGGDGGKAIEAGLAYPNGIAFDAEGNLYIADSVNHRIRKVDKAGIITTAVSGDGESGDGKRAVKAALFPEDIAFDNEGNLYIADTGNHRVLRLNKAGVITTVAGNGQEGCSGDGGLAVKAKITKPQNIAVDATGNLYIADYRNGCVRKVDKLGIITTAVADKSRFGR